MTLSTGFWRMCGDPPSVVRGVCLSPRVLHFGGDGAEQAAQIDADQGEGGDCRDRDQCDDQRILSLVQQKQSGAGCREIALNNGKNTSYFSRTACGMTTPLKHD